MAHRAIRILAALSLAARSIGLPTGRRYLPASDHRDIVAAVKLGLLRQTREGARRCRTTTFRLTAEGERRLAGETPIEMTKAYALLDETNMARLRRPNPKAQFPRTPAEAKARAARKARAAERTAKLQAAYAAQTDQRRPAGLAWIQFLAS